MPRDIVRYTERNLREAGGKGFEMFVLWSGVIEGDRFVVHSGHAPAQTASKTKHGLLVRVEGAALHQLNVWLYENQEVLGAQVHAHPTEAFHSETDDTFPIATSLGALSLVVPDFCRAGLLERSAAFRLTRDSWIQSPRPVTELIQVR